jgi:hypothetical protein
MDPRMREDDKQMPSFPANLLSFTANLLSFPATTGNPGPMDPQSSWG